MADIDLKTETPDASINDSAILFGADSQASANPSVYSVATVRSHFVGAGTLNVASGKTLTASNTLTLAGTDGTTMTFPTTSATLARTDAGNTFTGNQTLGSSDNLNWNSDTILTRRGAANLRLGAADVGSTTATVTITIATPGVVTWTGHGLSTGTPVFFTTTGALPTGITASTTYYVIAVDANTFQIATSFANALAGTAVNTSGSQSGTQTGNRNAITQRLSVQSVTGVTNRPGSDLVITGSQGTGTGAGGSIIFQVAPAGSSGTAQNALATALTIGADRKVTISGSATGIIFDNSVSGRLICSAASAPSQGMMTLGFGPGFNGVGSTSYAFSTNPGVVSADLVLERDDANKLALRNSTNAQEFRVYNTYTSDTNFERFRIFAQSAGSVIIGTQKGSGGGTARALEFQTDGTTRLTIATTGSGTATFTGAIWSSSKVGVGTDGSSGVQFLLSGTQDLRIVNGAGTDFGRIMLGGSTSSFPALKRSGASLIVRLADDSANAALESASVKTDAPAGGTSGTWKLGIAATVSPTSPNRTIEVDIGGTIYYIAAKTTND